MKQIYYTLQTLFRGRNSNIIKVVTLALGLLMSVFLFARIAFELSFDNFYHEPENLYLIKTAWLEKGVLKGSESDYTIHSIPGTIAEEFPDHVQSATTTFPFGGRQYRLGAVKYDIPTVMADTLYFATLGLDVLEGDPHELANPDIVFLSQSTARRVFGSESPLGKTLNYSCWGQEVTVLVKGIYADLPLNVTMDTRPESIVSFASIERHSWARLGWNSGGNYGGYLRLHSPADAEFLNERLTAAIARHIPADSGLELSVHITPVRSLHLENPRVRKMIWIMALLGVVLLFTTTLNYVLVSVASLTQRAKAIGVHKCSGASGRNILSMFLAETAVVIALALLVIGLLVYAFREKMEELAAVPLNVLFAWEILWAPLSAVGLLFVLGGCLPGVLFARIPVTQVFQRYTSGRRGWKRVLLFVQFGGAAFILGMMLVVVLQYNYATWRDRGFRPERVAFVYQSLEKPESLRSILAGLPYVESVASASNTMFQFYSPHTVTDNQGNRLFSPRSAVFDSDFQEFIGLRLMAGQGLSGAGQVLVNRTFVEKMQWQGTGVGERVNDFGTVAGVLDTFSFPLQQDDREPVMVTWADGTLLCTHVRLKEPFDDNLARLNEEMRRAYPQDELLFYSMEKEMRGLSESVRVFRDITLLASVTILFILLMGLVGYVSDEVLLRSKEIAIRKVNGAKVREILQLLSRDVLWLAVPAVVLGAIGAFKAGKVWISQFRDTVPLSAVWYVAVSICLLLFIVACVILKAWRIANENPVQSIKSE